MRYTSTLIVALLAASASAFVVPDDQEDGMYISTGGSTSAKLRRDASGPVKIGNITYSEAGGDISTSAIEKRMPVNAITCDPRNILNAWDYVDSRDNLKKFCNKGVKVPKWNGVSGILYARVGSAIWYACSWGGVNPCSGGEIDEAETRMDHSCGDDESAWVEMNTWKKGYGRAITGMSVCDQHP